MKAITWSMWQVLRCLRYAHCSCSWGHSLEILFFYRPHAESWGGGRGAQINSSISSYGHWRPDPDHNEYPMNMMGSLILLATKFKVALIALTNDSDASSKRASSAIIEQRSKWRDSGPHLNSTVNKTWC